MKTLTWKKAHGRAFWSGHVDGAALETFYIGRVANAFKYPHARKRVAAWGFAVTERINGVAVVTKAHFSSLEEAKAVCEARLNPPSITEAHREEGSQAEFDRYIAGDR